MKKLYIYMSVLILISSILSGCSKSNEEIKIGVSFGVGPATRWDKEKDFMQKRADEAGVDIEIRLNRTDTPKTQQQDCFEMIDSGIDVLILTPRDVTKASEILEYARENDVYVINYARVVLGDAVDLFVGYDSMRIGQIMGQFLTEMVYEGDFIILRGDVNDNNALLLYEGAIKYIESIQDDINILLDAPVPNWSPEEAKLMVMDAIKANHNKVDGILAPNDKIAGACAEVLNELNITSDVVITGMDAELEAIHRIIEGTQASTIFMDLKDLAYAAVDEAINIAKKTKLNVNATFDNDSENGVPAKLITGQLIIKQNIDKVLIEPGYFSHEDIYGPQEDN